MRAIRLGRRFEDLSTEDQHTLVLMYHQSQNMMSSPPDLDALSSFPIAQFLNTLVYLPPNEDGSQSLTRRREVLVVGDLNVSLFDLDTHDVKTSKFFSGHLPEERLHVATLVHLPRGLLPDLRLEVRRNQKAWRVPKPGLEDKEGDHENKDKHHKESVGQHKTLQLYTNDTDADSTASYDEKCKDDLVVDKESKADMNTDTNVQLERNGDNDNEKEIGDELQERKQKQRLEDGNGGRKHQEQEQDGYLSDSDRTSLFVQNRMISYDVAVQPILYDVFRLRHPLRTRAYTNWNTLKGLRQVNIGARIDVTLATPGLIITDEKNGWCSDAKDEEIEVLYPQTTADANSSQFGVDDRTFADIDPAVYGSDHCPVWIQFRLQRRFMSDKKTGENEPLEIGPFVAPKQCVKYVAYQVLSELINIVILFNLRTYLFLYISVLFFQLFSHSRYDPKFKGKQKSLMSFFGNTTVPQAETGNPLQHASQSLSQSHSSPQLRISQLSDPSETRASSPLQTIVTDPFSSSSVTTPAAPASRIFFSKIPKAGVTNKLLETITSPKPDSSLEKNTTGNEEEDEIQVSEVYHPPLVSSPSGSLSPPPPPSLVRRPSTSVASAFVSFGDDYFGSSPSLPKKSKLGFFSKKK